MAEGVELVTAWVRLVPTITGLEDAVTKELGGPGMEDAGQKAGDKWSAGAKVAMTAGAVAVSAAVVKLFNTGLEELKFGEQINAQTDMLVANTGFAMSTEQIGDYTLALSQLSGVSEEDLQSAGNELLKFGDISESAYQQAVASINDITSTGKDASSTAIGLGKALADPATAMGTLKRQGIMLNEEQQALIESFMAAGDKAAAQQVILDALEGTYGGMAEATGETLQGNIDKLGNAWENLAGDVTEMLMPALTGAVTILQDVITWVSENEGLAQTLAIGLGVLAAAWAVVTAAMWAASLTPIALIIGAIVLAIAGLVAGITLLATNWDTVWGTVSKTWTDMWEGFGGMLKDVWNGILDLVEGGVNGVVDLINGMISGVNDISGHVGIRFSLLDKVEIPRLAKGATVLPRAGGTAAIIAEAGKPESVVDTGLMNRALEQGLDGRRSRSSDRPIQIIVQGYEKDPHVLAGEVIGALQSELSS